MISFVPEFAGEMTCDVLPDDWVQRIRNRIDAGLFVPGIRSRANYQVRSSARDTIEFGADGFLTYYNIGLNEVSVTRMGRSQLRYHVTYWRWTRAAVGHGLLLAMVFVLLYAFMPQMRQDVDAYPDGRPMAGGII